MEEKIFNFMGCDLSLAKLTKTAFNDVVFSDCKMLGLHFENCNKFGFEVRFENCTLNHSSFGYSINPETNRIRKARFALSGVHGLLDKYDIEIDLKK